MRVACSIVVSAGDTMRRLTIILVSLATLTACGDECSTYSKYSCSQIENADYNVYFYFPDGSEKYLGQASGLSQCSATAGNYANQTGAPKSWICCMATASSSCEEKHR